jgi:hypothetical protein
MLGPGKCSWVTCHLEERIFLTVDLGDRTCRMLFADIKATDFLW